MRLAPRGRHHASSPRRRRALAAEAAAGDIEVVHSYRACREQAEACRGICGRRSCPGNDPGHFSFDGCH
ncbi:MAG TPA: hypothetical protein VF129_10730 [Actinomycetota bacterium]